MAGHVRAREEIEHDLRTRIKAIRISLEISVEALAERIGINVKMLKRYEDGSKRLEAFRLVQFADALGVTVAVLLGDEKYREDAQC